MLKVDIGSKSGACAYARKAQAVALTYALVVALVVGSALYMQNYLKRSGQGQLQAVGDQMGEQYALGLTTGKEHSESNTFFIEVRTAGLNNPTRITFTAGNFQVNEERRLQPLHRSWPNR